MQAKELDSDDLVRFCLLNKRGKVFKDWTYIELKSYVLECIENGEVAVITSKLDASILGIAFFTFLHKTKVLYMENILTLPGTRILRDFIELKNKHIPGWTIKGRRRGKEVVYNTPKLERRLCGTSV